MAVSDGYDDEHRPFSADGDHDEPTDVTAERLVMRCLPCLGRGAIRVSFGPRETFRLCPFCRGLGTRIVLLRGHREVFVDEEMQVEDLGRCKGAFRAGRRAAFGRVICTICEGRFRSLPGQRVPNHVARTSAITGGRPRATRR